MLGSRVNWGESRIRQWVRLRRPRVLKLGWRRRMAAGVAHCRRETLWLWSRLDRIAGWHGVALGLRTSRWRQSTRSRNSLRYLSSRRVRGIRSLLIGILHVERVSRIRLVRMRSAGRESWSRRRCRCSRRSHRDPISRLLSRLRLGLAALSRMLLLGSPVRRLPLCHPRLYPRLHIRLRARRARLHWQELAMRTHVVRDWSWLNASLTVHLSVSRRDGDLPVLRLVWLLRCICRTLIH